MSVSKIGATPPGAVVPGLPVRTPDASEERSQKEQESINTLDAGTSDRAAQVSAALPDRFEPSPEAVRAREKAAQASSQAASPVSKEAKAKAIARELAAIQQAAAQTRYGVNGQPSLQRDFESLLMAVNSGNLAAAEQALTRLQGASEDVIGTGDTTDASPPPA